MDGVTYGLWMVSIRVQVLKKILEVGPADLDFIGFKSGFPIYKISVFSKVFAAEFEMDSEFQALNFYNF